MQSCITPDYRSVGGAMHQEAVIAIHQLRKDGNKLWLQCSNHNLFVSPHELESLLSLSHCQLQEAENTDGDI